MADTEGQGRLVVLGVSWASGEPQVRVLAGDDAVSTHVPLVGLCLNYRTSTGATRRCLGHTPFRKADATHVDCAKSPVAGTKLCRSCSASDATFASNLHHAHTLERSTIDPAVAEHLRQPNLLYLAAFRDGSIKVGTTTAKRKHKRLLEQGAWRALLVAEASDGYVVRVLEDRVTEELAIAQSVSISRKLHGMASPIVDASLGEMLERHRASVHRLVRYMNDDRLAVHTEEWVVPGVDDAAWVGLHRYPLKLSSGQHDLEVVGACGRMVAVTRPSSDDTFIADLGQLYGIELDVGDYESDELAVQDSLF